MGGRHGDAGPQCKSFLVASASPLSTFSPHAHPLTQSSVLILQVGELRPGRRDLPKVTWRRTPNPRPPGQPVPCLLWQPASFSPLFRARLLSFLGEPAPTHFEQAES